MTVSVRRAPLRLRLGLLALALILLLPLCSPFFLPTDSSAPPGSNLSGAFIC